MQEIEEIQLGLKGEIFIRTKNHIFGHVMNKRSRSTQQLFKFDYDQFPIEAFSVVLSCDCVFIAVNKFLMKVDLKTGKVLEKCQCVDIADAILANDHFVVVQCESKLTVFDISNINQQRWTKIVLTESPLALSSYAYGTETSILAFQVENKNEIILKNLDTEAIDNISYETEIVAVAINPTNTKIATVSSCGTIIYVSNIRNGALVSQFHRGIASCVISDIRYISQDILVLSSDRPTVHMFDPAANAEANESYTSYVTSYFSGYLPSLLKPSSFAICTIPSDANSKVFAKKLDNGNYLVTVVSKEAQVTVFETRKNIREAKKLFALCISNPKDSNRKAQ